MNGFQVEIQDMNGIFRFPEADELGMTGIDFCLSLQNFACQEAFPPQGNQADSCLLYTSIPLPRSFLHESGGRIWESPPRFSVPRQRGCVFPACGYTLHILSLIHI